MLAHTIDEVIARLEAIITTARAQNSRLGYFPALYNRVTMRVRDGIRAGEFADGPRMERLDVIFANRYLEAYERYQAGELPSRSWLVAFEAAQRPSLIVLQHLMLGMNAHIHLDLAIAAARTCPGASLQGLAGDFRKINDVLASLVPVVEHEIDAFSPEFARFTGFVGPCQEKIVDFCMNAARDDAWSFAQRLAPLSLQAQVPLIAERDTVTAALSEGLMHLGPLGMWVWSRESKNVVENLSLLAQGEFDHALAA